MIAWSRSCGSSLLLARPPSPRISIHNHLRWTSSATVGRGGLVELPIATATTGMGTRQRRPMVPCLGSRCSSCQSRYSIDRAGRRYDSSSSDCLNMLGKLVSSGYRKTMIIRWHLGGRERERHVPDHSLFPVLVEVR